MKENIEIHQQYIVCQRLWKPYLVEKYRGNFGKNPKKLTISRDFGDKSPIFAHISYGQCGQACYSEVKMLMLYSAATVSTTVC